MGIAKELDRFWTKPKSWLSAAAVALAGAGGYEIAATTDPAEVPVADEAAQVAAAEGPLDAPAFDAPQAPETDR